LQHFLPHPLGQRGSSSGCKRPAFFGWDLHCWLAAAVRVAVVSSSLTRNARQAATAGCLCHCRWTNLPIRGMDGRRATRPMHICAQRNTLLLVHEDKHV
jgi:hypothetical protein